MRILYVSSEAAPFIKSGGLADVAGSLPQALVREGEDVRVILPLYREISDYWRSQMSFELYTYADVAWRKQYCGLFSLERGGVMYYFIDNEYYFDRPKLYGYYDDAERFAFFSRAIIELLPKINWKPDIISCNDWQSALVPIYLRHERADFYDSIRTVFTIHNIEYQGSFGRENMDEVLGLPAELFDNGLLRFGDQVNLLKGAIYYCDYLNTVSPTYASQLTEPDYAHGLHTVIAENSHKLRGILNGIDTELYNPETDPNIPLNYSCANISGKAQCKAELQRNYGLRIDANIPLVACVSRLVAHKGFALVADGIESLMGRDIQLIITGTGDPYFENRFTEMTKQNGNNGIEERYPGKLAVNIGYSEPESMRVYSGADIFLMPSRSEPCGLSQMIAMRYGTIPVVRETGGLKDSVRSYPRQDSNGFSFAYFSIEDMSNSLGEALKLYRNDRDEWERLKLRAMSCELNWKEPAKQYIEMYKTLI